MAVYNLQTVIGTTKTALQHQAGNPGDAAIADGYWSAGDGGGGVFYFEKSCICSLRVGAYGLERDDSQRERRRADRSNYGCRSSVSDGPVRPN